MVCHEALFALLGHTGGLIVSTKTGFRVSSSASFLVEHERALLERIANLGHSYVQLDSFMARVRDCAVTEGDGDVALTKKSSEGIKDGLYLRALCTGLDEVLDVYRSMVLNVERSALEDPSMPLTSISARAADFELLLPALVALTAEVEEKRMHGCRLLDVVAAHVNCGVPLVQACMQRILARCNMVLLAQVSAWVMHGMLTDPYREFFVHPATRSAHEDSSVGPQTELSRSNTSEEGLSASAAAAAAGYAEEQQYDADLSHKPACVSAGSLEKVLFCGVAMRVMLHPNNAAAEDRPAQRDLADFNARIHALARADKLSRAAFDLLVDDVHRILSQRLWRLVVVRARLPVHLRAVKDYLLLARGDLYQAFIDNTRSLLARPPGDTAEHDVNEPWRRAALLSFADEDEMFARTRLTLVTPEKGAEASGRGTEGEEEGALDRLRMVYEMEWPLGTLLLTPQVMAAYNQLFVFLLRVKRAQAELQNAWHETQSGRYGRAIASTLHKLTLSSRHMTGMWALRSEMALLVNNLLYYLQCDVVDAHFEALREQVQQSDSFETIRSAHARFLERVSNESLLRNKLAFSTVTALLRIILQFARRMAQWKQIDKGQVESARSLKRFTVSDSATAVNEAYLGFPITVGGEISVITGYTAAREVTLYRPLKSAGVSGDVEGCAEDLVGSRYIIQAPTVSPEELSDVRRRFQRNAHLLFTVLKASQTHTTPVLAQLLLRLDFNRFHEQSQR